MVYVVHSKIKVVGTLAVVRSLHVGGFGTSTNVDLPLAVNGKGEVYIPGTSLAGALRSWMTKLCDSKTVETLWGYQPEKGSEQEGYASRVMIEDAVAMLPLPKGKRKAMTLQEMEVRSGVGIDRSSGTAAENYLYNRGVISRGAMLAFELSVDIADSKQEASTKHAIDQLLLAMQSEEIRLGAAKSRGLGRVRLIECQQPILNGAKNRVKSDAAAEKGVQPFRISDRAGMLAFLSDRVNPKSNLQSIAKPDTTLTLPRLLVKLFWHPVGPLMVKSELTGDAVDILPLMGSVGTKSAFLLPGSSIKGALRSQAERIVRTVLQRPLDADQPSDFTHQIRLPLIDTLFGLAADDEAVGPNAKNGNASKWAAGLGSLFIEDCFSQTEHPADTLQRLSRIPKDNVSQLQAELEATALTGENSKDNVDTQLAYHVAVDRWTGGAADSFLYTNLEPFHLPWEPIELTIDFNHFPNDETAQLAGVALLLLLLRDMANRRIPLGYGTNRGLGTMTVGKVDFKACGDVPEPLKSLDSTNWQAGEKKPLNFESLDSTALAALNDAWNLWIKQSETNTDDTGGAS